MTHTPLLSICIPSYNRCHHLEKLLLFLSHSLLDDPRFDLEVIAVNNASTDGTRDMLARFPDKRIRVINRDQHLLTSEENIFRSLDLCNGQYVWFLGDDDMPVLGIFARHYALLQADAHDYLLFNPAMIDPNGSLAVLQNVKMNRYQLELPIADLVTTIGCLFTLAGISNSIIRRRLLSTERGLHYMGISQIYSMVAWIIEAARNARVVFVNAPLVAFRENDYSDGHWGRVAERMNVGDYHFWSVGLVSLLDELIRARCLTTTSVGAAYEVNREGHRYSLVDDILYKYHQQVTTARKSREPRQQLTPAQLEQATNFFAKVDPSTHDLVGLLRAMASASHAAEFQRLDERFLQLFNDRQAIGTWARRVIHTYSGYEIIATPVQLTAIRLGHHALRETVMGTIDPLPQPPLVLAARTWEELAPQIDEAARSSATAEAQASQRFMADYVKAAASANDALHQLTSIYSSDLWQATYPYRFVRDLIKKLTRARRGGKS